MRNDDANRANRIARLKLSAIVASLIVVAVIAGIVLRLIEWF